MWSYAKEDDGFSHSPSLSLDSTSSETSRPVRVNQQVHHQGRERKTIYVGGLHAGIEREDLRKKFKNFGTIRKIWVAHKPPGFAFIEFSDDQEANSAIQMNGARINGCQIKVAVAHDKNQMSNRYGQFRAGGGGGGGGGSCSYYGDRAGHNNCGGQGRRKLRGGSRGGGGGGGRIRSRSPIGTAFH